jgi:tetratricopeptide (TPR) repeat protein
MQLVSSVRRVVRRALPAAALFALSSRAAAQHADHSKPAAPQAGAPLFEGLGSFEYPITTSNPRAQRYFNQGLSLAYAFNHAEAKRSFEEAARLDPNCAMCQWGIAYVLGPNINAPMTADVNAEAYRAAQRAVELAARATEKEQAYARTIALRYAATPPESRASLDSAYANGMRELAAKYPDDANAASLFAESLMDLSPWVYWSKDKKPLAATNEIIASLERAMRLDPKNPGACHFYIHAVEAAFPQRAVACSEKLAALMPGAGHLVHMPAHIYLRVGRYNEAITANEHAVHADESYIADQRVQGFYTLAYYPHNYHFLAFAASMAGRAERALSAAREAAKNTPVDVAAGVPELQLLSAYPAVMNATFGRWDAALAEPLPRTDLRLATGLAWYARGVSHAALGHLGEAQAALDSVRSAATSIKTYPGNATLAIAEHALIGEIAARRKNHQEAIAALTEAMRREDELTYMEPPYWHQPVRHILGAVLLDAGRASDAEKLFREDLERFPENVWSLRGLEKSLRAQSKVADADATLQRFRKASAKSDIKLTSSKF